MHPGQGWQIVGPLDFAAHFCSIGSAVVRNCSFRTAVASGVQLNTVAGDLAPLQCRSSTIWVADHLDMRSYEYMLVVIWINDEVKLYNLYHIIYISSISHHLYIIYITSSYIIYISSISHHLYHNHSLFSNISQLQNADLNPDLPVLPKPLRSRHGAPHRSALRGGTAPAAVGAGEFGRRSGSRACRYRRSMMIYVDWLGWFLDVFGQGSKINMAQKCEIYM